MANCSNCGAQVEAAAVSCPTCGHPGPGARTALFDPIERPAPRAPFATYGQRVAASLVDGLLLGGLALFFLATGLISESVGPLAIAGFIGLASMVYQPLLEGARGQTLGKMAVNIKVVRAGDRKPIGYPTAIARWAFGGVFGFVPVLGLADVLWPLWDRSNQTLHDKAANTVVVTV